MRFAARWYGQRVAWATQLSPPTGEMRQMPYTTETRIAAALSAVAPHQAASPEYWAACHIRWIADHLLGANGAEL